MNADDYQNLALRTECDTPAAEVFERYARFVHACLGLTKEAGELQSLACRLVFYGKHADRDEASRLVCDELGDVLWFCALAASASGLTLGEVMAANAAKLRARYPSEFSPALCENKDRAAEALAQAAALATTAEPAPETTQATAYHPLPSESGIDDDTGMCEFGQHQWLPGGQHGGSDAYLRCRLCGTVKACTAG